MKIIHGLMDPHDPNYPSILGRKLPYDPNILSYIHQGSLHIEGDFRVNYPLRVYGSLTVNGNCEVYTYLRVNGSLDIAGHLFGTPEHPDEVIIFAEDRIFVAGDVQIDGTLTMANTNPEAVLRVNGSLVVEELNVPAVSVKENCYLARAIDMQSVEIFGDLYIDEYIDSNDFMTLFRGEDDRLDFTVHGVISIDALWMEETLDKQFFGGEQGAARAYINQMLCGRVYWGDLYEKQELLPIFYPETQDFIPQPTQVPAASLEQQLQAALQQEDYREAARLHELMSYSSVRMNEACEN